MTVRKRLQSGGVSSEDLNFILAVCAVLISAASFYATYLQADSSERQVKAMTMPQFSHGNYDDETDSKEISLTIINSGIGPAIIRRVDFNYADQNYPDLSRFLKACCEKEVA